MSQDIDDNYPSDEDEELTLFQPVQKSALHVLTNNLLRHTQNLYDIDTHLTEIQRDLEVNVSFELLKNYKLFVIDEIIETESTIQRIISQWKDYFGETDKRKLVHIKRLEQVVNILSHRELQGTVVNLRTLVNEFSQVIQNENLAHRELLRKMVKTWNDFVASFDGAVQNVLEDDEDNKNYLKIEKEKKERRRTEVPATIPASVPPAPRVVAPAKKCCGNCGCIVQ